jgi:hypothetical protein
MAMVAEVGKTAATSADPQAGENSTVADREKDARLRIVESRGYRIELDLTTQVLKIGMPDDRGMLWWDDRTTKGPNGFRFAGVHPESLPKQLAAPISPTIRNLRSGILSASILAQKAKQFDDGLYAAVDLAAQNGCGGFPGKLPLLKSIAGSQTAGDIDTASEVVLAAARLGGLEFDLAGRADRAVLKRIRGFLDNPLRSKPIGFYTWSEELQRIFQQDRMLQSPIQDPPGVERLAGLLHADRTSREIYEGYLTLISRLTNPFPSEYPTLACCLTALDQGSVRVPHDTLYFFPPSRAHETELVKRLYGHRPIPRGFNLAEELVKRIRSGKIALEPTDSSGWYDYQTWSLEPLVIPGQMPEAKHLRLESRYREQLVELFKGILTLTRETHIKQLEIPRVGSAPPRPTVKIFPKLSAEPLATHYLRRALSYRFVRQVITDTFGPEALVDMHRMTAGGPVANDLATELAEIEALFLGAYVLVSRELGMEPDLAVIGTTDREIDSDARAFQKWAAELGTDPDIGVDSRAMIPVFYDIQRRKTKVWLFLGWAERPVTISFATPPEAKVFDSDGNPVPGDSIEIEFESTRPRLTYPVTAEIYVTEILNREEFRRLCDEHRTRSAILAALK